MDTSEIDVAIIGGGFAGCATARALAERGIRARVLEREPELGRHASGRGAGLGRQLAEDDATSALTVRGAQLLRERHAEAWDPTGGILTFDDATEAQEYMARAVRLGIPFEPLEHEAVLARWPTLTKLPIAGAMLVPSDGVIDTKRLLARLAHDLDIVLAAAVLAVEPAGDRVRLDTTAGTFRARVVVDAAGAWAGLLTNDPPLETFRRHLFVLEAAPVERAPFLWHLGGCELYLRADGPTTLACPCDADPTAPIDQQPVEQADVQLRARLRVAPRWSHVPILRRWACQRAFTPDRQMRIGRDPRRPWLVWAAGLGGHGATAATAVGELAADAVVCAL
ncbi:MAG TPA: FAD-dependent oxidoreductase [Kofleriaceae bacterium]|nr:FAD-dependent oxidoreductase [Kofleriaceae bacterium]